MEAEIKLKYRSPLFAESVKNALNPDNKLMGGGMRIAARTHGRIVSITIRGCSRVETLQATVQDVFRCLRAAESSLSRLEQRKRA
ncbi:MAG: KEOPS complex subunit Pcc1 [Candidatus Bathyarchaeia archaeon]